MEKLEEASTLSTTEMIASPVAKSNDVSAAARSLALRKEITSPEPTFILEAHNGLSARIAEEAGFRAIWASGLTISSSMGLRDSNEASWTQVLDVLEYMSDATSVPILVDGDTGHGNFNNVRRFVRKLGERSIAGVCIEDKLFPKTNSFVGEGQALAPIDEFCGRIKAGKDSQLNDDFVLVARVEALISGHSMSEALTRAEAYRAAGADAILIHSKRKTAEQVLEFAEKWDSRCPLIIVPTTYYQTPTAEYYKSGISGIIWANHLLRSAVAAMQDVAATIAASKSIGAVEDRVAPVAELFRLAGNGELLDAERRYLPERPAPGAVILAASRGAFSELTQSRPKCMLDVRGRPLLNRLVSTLAESGLRRISVVGGYRIDAVADDRVRIVENPRHAETGEVYSLSCAGDQLSGDVIVAYGDVLFRRYIADALLSCDAEIVIAVDGTVEGDVALESGSIDLVAADRPYIGSDLDDVVVHLKAIGRDLPAAQINGRYIGLARFTATGVNWLRSELDLLKAEGLLDTADMATLLSRLALRHPIRVLYFSGHWIDVNSIADLAEARNFV